VLSLIKFKKNANKQQPSGSSNPLLKKGACHMVEKTLYKKIKPKNFGGQFYDN